MRLSAAVLRSVPMALKGMSGSFVMLTLPYTGAAACAVTKSLFAKTCTVSPTVNACGSAMSNLPCSSAVPFSVLSYVDYAILHHGGAVAVVYHLRTRVSDVL